MAFKPYKETIFCQLQIYGVLSGVETIKSILCTVQYNQTKSPHNTRKSTDQKSRSLMIKYIFFFYNFEEYFIPQQAGDITHNICPVTLSRPPPYNLFPDDNAHESMKFLQSLFLLINLLLYFDLVSYESLLSRWVKMPLMRLLQKAIKLI